MNKENGMGGSVMSTDNQSARINALMQFADEYAEARSVYTVPEGFATERATLESALCSALAQAPAPSGEALEGLQRYTEEYADLHRHIHRMESGRYDRSDLVRALAVILAEIERLDRAAAPKGASK